ncbi:Phosphoadenosine phosphosulfate reductase [Hydrogenophaga intermedia]|uniref:Phosphoadenosine phosphosulfate reductase n=1 Tax=Hydrogenophaga intermedia TaxID=65786 RepID=A0A1L1PPS1_HYDIT|nr:phosphoadenosine phosphosulfate reductase family protein [Hydrogenophaga intermedia]CDN87345.1 Phosphoadenosine phosphosulfate reductase [Hydrogenophaga intermedia]
MTILHVVSVSGGKDSAATSILALETQPRASLRFVACDTGNEHDNWHGYLAYMESTLGITITVLPKRDFSEQIARKREYVVKHWPRKGCSQADIDRSVRALQPTGNPFLDLCIWKGRFPSRKAQFCTQELKTIPMVEHQMGLIDSGQCDAVWSWQGVRIDESEARRARLQGTGACVKAFEEQGGGIYTYRPILRWTAADAFEAHRIAGLEPNPLYLQGMSRVGCMPCINAGKDELLEISKRFPHHIDRIAYWEMCVGMASRRMQASFFPDPDRDAHLNKRGIRNMVEWSKTKRGGQLVDWIRLTEEPKACESAYGLCE